MTGWERNNRRRLQYEKRHTVNVERSLRWQIEPVLDALKDSEVGWVVSNADTLIKDDTIKVAFRKIYADTGTDYAGHSYNNVQGKGAKDELSDKWMEEMLVFADTMVGDRIISITKTSIDRAKKILMDIMQTQVIPEGLSIFETQNLIRDKFIEGYIGVKKPFTITGRARVIAQTEVMTASNRGSQLGAVDANAQFKQWLTSGIILPDSPPRHVGYPGLHAQKRGINEDFDVRGYPGDYPGSPTLPASESVNCKCAVVFSMDNNFRG